MSTDGQGTKWRRNIADNFNCLSRVHQRYRQTTDDRRTDDDIIIANRNLSSRSLKTFDKTQLPGIQVADSAVPTNKSRRSSSSAVLWMTQYTEIHAHYHSTSLSGTEFCSSPTAGSHYLAYKKFQDFSRTFRDPKNVFPGLYVAQQC